MDTQSRRASDPNAPLKASAQVMERMFWAGCAVALSSLGAAAFLFWSPPTSASRPMDMAARTAAVGDCKAALSARRPLLTTFDVTTLADPERPARLSVTGQALFGADADSAAPGRYRCSYDSGLGRVTDLEIDPDR